MKYPVLLCDPPVPFEVWSKPTKPGSGNRSAEDHYKTMTWDDLAALGPAINAVAADDAVLFLWLCQPLLIETLRMIEGWNEGQDKAQRWEYKTKAFCWVKTRDTGFHVGMGYWTRANSEDVLLFTRGHPKRNGKDVAQIIAAHPHETPTIVAPLTDHSRKPAEVHRRIERLVSGPYLELFARRPHAGWQTVGNECDGLDIRESLARLANDEPLPRIETAQQQMHLLEAA